MRRPGVAVRHGRHWTRIAKGICSLRGQDICPIQGVQCARRSVQWHGLARRGRARSNRPGVMS
eukprot:910609-Lingulodinium_polyedra.AAC.1